MKKKNISLALAIILGSSVLGSMLAFTLSERGPSCEDWQSELSNRVASYLRMHAPDPARIQVEVEGICREPLWLEPVRASLPSLLWRLGLSSEPPLELVSLHMASTQALLDYPRLPALRIIVALDAEMDPLLRKQLQEIGKRYLKLKDRKHKLIYRKLSTVSGASAARTSDGVSILAPKLAYQFQSFSWQSYRDAGPVLFEESHSELRGAVLETILLSLIAMSSLYLLFPYFLVWLRRQKIRQQTLRSTEVPSFFSARLAVELGDRSSAILELLRNLDPVSYSEFLRREAQTHRPIFLYWLLSLTDSEQGQALELFSTDEKVEFAKLSLMQEAASFSTQQQCLQLFYRLKERIKAKSHLPNTPLWLHCLQASEWRFLAQQLSKSKRRLLAQYLDPRRAEILLDPKDRQEERLSEGMESNLALDEIYQKMEQLLQAEAKFIRSQLSDCPGLLHALHQHLEQWTTQKDEAEIWEMLILSREKQNWQSLPEMIQNHEPLALAAIKELSQEQQMQLFSLAHAAARPSYQAVLTLNVEQANAYERAMREDRQSLKKDQQKAKSLQRFIEREVLLSRFIRANSPPASVKG